MGSLHTARISFLAIIALLAFMHLAAPRVAAECFGETDPWPSFRDAIPTAGRIVVGEVVASDGGSTGYLAAFRLRVQHVVRGPIVGSEFMEIVGLTSGLPPVVCADSVATLLDGDVVAIAFDARGPDGATAIHTIAYLEHAGPSILTGVEDIDMVELRARTRTQGDSTDAAVMTLVLVVVAIAVGARLLRVRRKTAQLSAPLLLLSLVVAACGGGPSVPSPAASPTPPPTASSDVSDAVDVRTSLGLRNDRAHVEAIASDLAAIETGRRTGFGIPLTVAEAQELLQRARSADAVAEAIAAYARTVPDRRAGLFVDQAAGGVVVAQFSGDPETHRVALARLLQRDARFEVRAVRWSHRDLQPLWDAVERQRAWFDSIGAPLTGSGISEVDNLVTVHVASDDPMVVDIVIDHFDADGRMRVVPSGLPTWRGGFGMVTLRITDLGQRDGHALRCILRAAMPGALDNDLSAGVGADGTCIIRAPATVVSIAVVDEDTGAEVGRVATTVARGRSTTVTVILTIESR